MAKFNKKQYLTIFTLSIILIVSLLSITGTFATSSVYDAGTGDTQYQELLIDNTGGSTLSGYQLPTTIEYDSNMQSDFDDIVFAELDGTILKHYKMSYTDSTSAKMYILIDCDADSTKKIAMYYGNPTMSDASDDSMFELFDHFNGGSVDGAKWECTAGDIGTVTVSNSKLQMSASDLTSMKSIASFSCPVIVEASHAYGEGMFGIMDTNLKNLLFYNVGGGSIVQIKMNEGTEQFAASSYSPNVLQDKKIVWASDYVQFYVNDVAQLDPAKTSLITTDDMRIYWQDVPHSTDDGIFAFDWILVRKYVADEPTVTFQKATPYDIDENIDLVIPISVEGSGTITKYLTKPAGHLPNPNGVYELYDDFNDDSFDTTKWDIAGYAGENSYSESNGYLRMSLTTANLKLWNSFTSDQTFDYPIEVDTSVRMNDGKNFFFVGVGNLQSLDYDTRNVIYTKSFNTPDPFPNNVWETINLKIKSGDSTYTFKDVEYPYSETIAGDYYLKIYNCKWDAGYAPDLDIDWISVKQLATNAPTAAITDMGTYYKIVITNNEASALSGYQMTIDGTEFSLSTQTDSLLITDILPTTLSEESIAPNSTTIGNSVILSATFSDTIADATATITKPDASTADVDLSNSEGNTWTASLSYTDLGNYTIDDYKINSELKTLESGLTFEITAVPPSTPSSGGGGSSSSTTVIDGTETIIEENTVIVKEESQQIKSTLDPYTDYLFIFVFIILGLIVTYMIKTRQR